MLLHIVSKPILSRSSFQVILDLIVHLASFAFNDVSIQLHLLDFAFCTIMEPSSRVDLHRLWRI